MGVGGGFWDVLRPVARKEDLAALRGKKLAIDLSYWMIQLQTAVKGNNVRKPHLRLLFFRTINLVAKIGAFPVFVTDGDPPPMKLQARLERFSRISGIPLNISAEGTSLTDHKVARNSIFTEHIEECVELLKLLGMPVLRAKYEAEGLCAELDREGLVHACVTPDSDAFLYGAKCVIKHLQADFKEPLVESYIAADIETVLGLHREHLVALALLAGCDYNTHGVPGIGCSNAVRLIRMVPKHEILDRLQAWGEGKLMFQSEMDGSNNRLLEVEKGEEDGKVDESVSKRGPHCSNCGHPGTKKLHAKHGCEQCRLDGTAGLSGQGCRQKVQGFKCMCGICTKEQIRKKHVKQKGWHLKLCQKIAATRGFPNKQIIQIYMDSGHGNLAEEKQELFTLPWKSPQIEALEKFLADHLHWDKIYVRQKVLPLLSLICLQEIAAMKESGSAGLSSSRGLIYGLYAPHSIQRIKISFSKPLYTLRWGQVSDASAQGDWLGLKSANPSQQRKMDSNDRSSEVDEMGAVLHTEAVDNSLFFTTDEDMILVRDACPKLVTLFEHEQEAKSKSRKRSVKRKKAQDTSSAKQQLSITSFFKAKKEGVTVDDTVAGDTGRDMATREKTPARKEVIIIEDTETVENVFLYPCKVSKIKDEALTKPVTLRQDEEGFTPPSRSLKGQSLKDMVIETDSPFTLPSGSLKGQNLKNMVTEIDSPINMEEKPAEVPVRRRLFQSL